MSARSQLQSKPVADLRSIAESLGIEHKGLQKAKLIDLLVEHSDDILDSILVIDSSTKRSCAIMALSKSSFLIKYLSLTSKLGITK